MACAFSLTSRAADISDNAQILGKELESRLNFSARDIRREYRAGLKIETFSKAPFDVNDAAVVDLEKESKFSRWLRSRADAAGKDSVYILLVKSPPYLLVSGGELLRERGVFTREDRNALMHLLAQRLRRDEAAKGMIEAAAFVRNTLANRVDGTAIPVFSPQPERSEAVVAPSQESTQGWLSQLGLGLILLFGGWLVWNVYRAGTFSRSRQTANEQT